MVCSIFEPVKKCYTVINKNGNKVLSILVEGQNSHIYEPVDSKAIFDQSQE